MLAGRMMNFPLTLTHFLRRAADFFPRSEVVSRRPDRSLTRHTYEQIYRRCAQLSHALARLGVGAGDRVATLSWNHHQHLEAYLAVPAMGAVVHTLNLRLHPSEIGYIANHAEDQVVIVDRSLLPLFEKFAGQVRSIRHVIVVPDCPDTGAAPANNYLDYEALLGAEEGEYPYPDLDENSAADRKSVV